MRDLQLAAEVARTTLSAEICEIEQTQLAVREIDRHDMSLIVAFVAGLGIRGDRRVEIALAAVRRDDGKCRRTFLDVGLERDELRPSAAFDFRSVVDRVAMDVAIERVGV